MSATLSNKFRKTVDPQRDALSNLLTMPPKGGLGDKKARLDYCGFPHLFDGVATSNNQGGFFISRKITDRANAQTLTRPYHRKDQLSMDTNSLPHKAQNGQKSRADKLSANLEEARTMEEHYRSLLLFWKNRRQGLESQIPLDDPFEEFLRGLSDDA